MAEQQRDVIEVLEHDHREVEEMFSELETLRGASADDAMSRRKALADQVTIELVRHSVAEEILVYPQVEDKVSAEEAKHAREAASRLCCPAPAPSLVLHPPESVLRPRFPIAVLVAPRH